MDGAKRKTPVNHDVTLLEERDAFGAAEIAAGVLVNAFESNAGILSSPCFLFSASSCHGGGV